MGKPFRGLLLLLGCTTSVVSFAPMSRQALLPAKRHTMLFRQSAEDRSMEREMNVMEQQVLESTRARMDQQRLQNFLLSTDNNTSTTTESWKVALAGSMCFGSLALASLHSIVISLIVSTVVFFKANADPLDPEDDVDLIGTIARLMGRLILKSQPKVQAITRAVVTDQDSVQQQVQNLQQDVDALRQENKDLRLWKKQREAADQAMGNYSAEELKQLARSNNISIGSMTKSQLLFRLVQEGIVPSWL